VNQRFVLLCVAAAAAVFSANLCAQNRTTVRDTLYNADGSRTAGQIEITWNAFLSADGKTIAAGKITRRITDGVLGLALVPNAGTTPAGTSYAVTYLLASGLSYSETWVVPQSDTPVSLAAVRVTVAPPPAVLVAQQQISEGTGMGVLLDFYRAASATATRAGQCYWNTTANALHCSTGTGAWQNYAPGTPAAHASTHASNGADPLGINASQITSGTLADSLLPATIAGDKTLNGSLTLGSSSLKFAGTLPGPTYPYPADADLDAMFPFGAIRMNGKAIAYVTDDAWSGIWPGTALILPAGEGWLPLVKMLADDGWEYVVRRDASEAAADARLWGFGLGGGGTADNPATILGASNNEGADAFVFWSLARHNTGDYEGYQVVLDPDRAGGTAVGGNFKVFGSAETKKLNGIPLAHLYSGNDAGEKIAACIVALPATGGTCDARGLEGAQAISADPFVGVTKSVRLIFAAATYTSSVSIIVPNNITLEFLNGAQISMNVATTLSIRGAVVNAGNTQCFAGAGTVVLPYPFRQVRDVYPQWWGAKADGATDDAAAIQKALTASKDLHLIGDYFIASSLSISDGQHVTGSNLERTILRTNAAINMITTLVSCTDCQISTLTLDGGDTALTGITLGAAGVLTERVSLDNVIVTGVTGRGVVLNNVNWVRLVGLTIHMTKGVGAINGLKVTESYSVTLEHAWIQGSTTPVYVERSYETTLRDLYTYDYILGTPPEVATQLVWIKDSQTTRIHNSHFEPAGNVAHNVLLENTFVGYDNRMPLDNLIENCYFVGNNTDSNGITVGTAAGSPVYRTNIRNNQFIAPKGGKYDINVINGVETLIERNISKEQYGSTEFSDPIINLAGSTSERIVYWQNMVNSWEVLDRRVVAAESLTDGTFALCPGGGCLWGVSGGWDAAFTGNKANYDGTGGAGNLTQTFPNMAIAGMPNRWYRFTYTVTVPLGNIGGTITNAFASAATTLPLTAGTHTVDFRSNAAPGSFVIAATGAGSFSIDALSLLQVLGGDLVVNRSLCLGTTAPCAGIVEVFAPGAGRAAGQVRIVDKDVIIGQLSDTPGDNSTLNLVGRTGDSALYANLGSKKVGIGGPVDPASALSVGGATTGNLQANDSGVVVAYKNIATVANGVPSEYATADLTAHTAAKGVTVLYAVPAAGAGRYRISWVAKLTTPGSVSSVLGGTAGFQVTYTDADDSVVLTPLAVPNAVATGNSTATQLSGVVIVNAKASTNISYQFDYTSAAANTMAYSLYVHLEAM
jgi:hypothetical protein